MELTRAFIHGLESTSQGTKGVYFRKKYPDMIIEDFFGPFEQRMEKLNGLLAGKNDLILVGSSYGGLMAAVYACNNEERMKKLILLAPALHIDPYKPYLNHQLHIPVTIFHGKDDDLVPPDAIQNIARKLFVNHTYHLMDDDHPLHRTFSTYDWDSLLSFP
jgi:predicted esterase